MKRFIDLFLSIVALSLLLLPLLFIALLIYLKMGGPVLFKQVRPGLNGACFTMYKFRSMINGSEGMCSEQPDVGRITKLGKLLRSTSVDELPGLWNVIKGDMSLVGPRPLLVQYLPLYTTEQSRRHHVRPGITGWAQVNGRNAISWEEKFKLDVWYVDNQSIWLDIKILWLTIRKVLVRDGISATGEATMQAFTGTCTRNSIEQSK